MNCDQARRDASLALDGELDQAERQALDEHLRDCSSCREQVERWGQIGEELSTMPFAVKHDRALDAFEGHVYARLERGVAWILLSIGAALLLASGGYYLVRDFLIEPTVPLGLRAGVGVGLLGLIVLVVGVARHRLATSKSDPYKGVKR